MYGGLFDLFVGILEPIFPVYNAIFGIFFKFMGTKAASICSMALLSATVALIISSFYVILIDRDEYNRIREKQKELQNKMKEAQDNDNMEKANKFMKESMGMQKKFMKASIKPMIASMFIFFLFVPWVLSTYVPVVNAQPGSGNQYNGQMDFVGFSTSHSVSVTGNQSSANLTIDGQSYQKGDKIDVEGYQFVIEDVRVKKDSAKVKMAYSFFTIPFGIPLIGSSFEWLSVYILFQLPFTFGFRKMLGVQ